MPTPHMIAAGCLLLASAAATPALLADDAPKPASAAAPAGRPRLGMVVEPCQGPRELPCWRVELRLGDAAADDPIAVLWIDPSSSSVSQLQLGAARASRPDDRVEVTAAELLEALRGVPSSFRFDATVDRFDGATYPAGAQFRVKCDSQQAGYVTIVAVDARGQTHVLTPSERETHAVAAASHATIPAAEGRAFSVGDVAGDLHVHAIVTARPLRIVPAAADVCRIGERPSFDGAALRASLGDFAHDEIVVNVAKTR